MNWRAALNELLVLGIFAFGGRVSARFGRRWSIAEIAVMYQMGLLFELLTAHMWIYPHILLVFPSRIDHDLSILFPLAWAGWIMTTTSVAEHLWLKWRCTRWWQRHLVLMGVWLVIGDAAETLFYRIGLFEYVDDPGTRVNFLLGQVQGLPPTMVLLGYLGVPPLASQFMRWLERSLPRHGKDAPR